jgi:hypothetical protein
MVKTFLKQVILEECINTFFDKVIYNFTPIKQEDVKVTYKKTFLDRYYTFYITINNKGKSVKFLTRMINIGDNDPVKYGNNILEICIYNASLLRLSLYEYLNTFYNKC